MGIFSGLFRSRDKPTDSTVGSRYAFYMGGSTSGKSMGEKVWIAKIFNCDNGKNIHMRFL